MFRTFQLTPRLQSIAQEIPRGVKIVDVGTDHAYLPVWLLNERVIDSAIGTDLREGPLERARLTAGRYGVAEKISLRLCDGLSGVSAEEAEYITIAGMGGETIASILAATPWLKDGAYILLLQPMSSHEDLRAYLSEHDFRIEEEILSREGDTIYVTLRVVPGESEPYSLGELWVGKQSKEICAPLRLAFLDQVVYKLARALHGLESARLPEQLERKAQYQQVIEHVKQLREEWIKWQR